MMTVMNSCVLTGYQYHENELIGRGLGVVILIYIFCLLVVVGILSIWALLRNARRKQSGKPESLLGIGGHWCALVGIGGQNVGSVPYLIPNH